MIGIFVFNNSINFKQNYIKHENFNICNNWGYFLVEVKFTVKFGINQMLHNLTIFIKLKYDVCRVQKGYFHVLILIIYNWDQKINNVTTFYGVVLFG